MSGSTTVAGMIPVSGLESIIYLKPRDAMMRYGFLGERGVLLVYTRGNGPTVGGE
jgi:hypothetical protein